MAAISTIRPAILESFPSELKMLSRWILWRLEPPAGNSMGKPTKVPYQTNGYKASVTDSETWTSYQQVVTHLNGYAGLGFVLAEQDDLFFVDLDDCVDPDTGVIAPWAEDLIDDVRTYVELSPSRTGLHFLGKRGKLPLESRRKGKLEIYTTRRFTTVTGWHLSGTPQTLETCDLSSIHARMMNGEFVFA